MKNLTLKVIKKNKMMYSFYLKELSLKDIAVLG